MLQKNLENEINVISIFKPNVALANVVWDLGSWLQWEGQETVWIEITVIEQRMKYATIQ